MITCDRCKNWEQEDNLGSCICDKFKIGYDYAKKEIADDEVLVEDDEGWAFFTGPKFGCIHGISR